MRREEVKRSNGIASRAGKNLGFKKKNCLGLNGLLGFSNFIFCKALLGVAYTYGADSMLEIQLRH